jgi:regulator of sigma E protease
MVETPIVAAMALALSLSSIGNFLIYLALLSALIIIHEFGQFVFAKRAGVTVTDFAIGFGPSLVSIRRGDTTYRINLLPLGGYCKMLGEDENASNDPGNFNHKSVGARLSIIAAGPIFNLILAAIIFAALGATVGVPAGPTTVVESVEAGSAAAAAGLQAGDQIVALNGTPIRSGTDMIGYIRSHAGHVLRVDIVRDHAPKTLPIADREQLINGQRLGALGFYPQVAMVRQPPLVAVVSGVAEVGTTAATQFVGIVDAIRNHDTSVISGPVGIAHVVMGAVALGAPTVLQVGAVISVVLGLFNLLPVPALDGGRLAFLLVEFVRGRPVNPEREGLVHLAGFALLMVLVAFVTYHDIVLWVNGKGGL